MKAAFIVMSILGCDDAGVTCLPIALVEQQWQTIAACDTESEKHLARYANANHPMVVAVCQTANSTALADSTEDSAQFDSASLSDAPVPSFQNDEQQQRRGITARAIELVKGALPTRKALTETASYPVHVVTDTYSWVARKITN